MGDLLRRRLGTVVVLLALLVLFSANRIAVLATDFWWFDERGYRSVFTTILSTRLLLGFAAGAVLVALIAGNLFLARRLRPFYVPESPQQAQVQRYREMADPYLPWLIIGIALVFGFTSGLAFSTGWESWLLFRSGGTFGVADPHFDVDVGYYMFQLPFWSTLQTWLFTSLILTGLLTAGAHYLLGGIRPEAEGEKILPSVKAHLAVLLAAILAVRAWGYWLDRYQLMYSPRGTVTGAAYTDINAELPALYLLIGVSAIAIVLILLSIRRRGFLLPGAAVGLLIVASIILQGAYPAAVQRLQVDPQELSREEQYLARNLEATRAAYGLDDVELGTFTIVNDLDEQDVIENDITLRNVRLWDPSVLETTYQELQSLRPYYEFNDVSIDRYEINGELRQVMIATRSLSQLQPSADTWQNRHITYTHGYGVVASQVNTANAEGQPVFLASNIPPQGAVEIVPEDDPGVYFGDFASPAYSLVRTDAAELDYEEPGSQEQVLTSYEGNGGVDIGSFTRRLAFALRFNDYNIVLPNPLNDESRIIFNREVRERVQQVAPFLELDADPYPAVVDGRVQWIVDAYTTSNMYPYSQRDELLIGNRPVPVNYVRNSVKAVVDGYHGDITLYRVEEDDPVLDAWESAFPGIVTPVEDVSESLRRHFRYPQDIFRLQAELYQAYHIPTADAFYNRADEWSIPPDPAAAANETGAELAQAAGRPLEPYYLLMRLPGEPTEEFVLIQPYLARGRPNMVAWLAGRSDGEHLGELFAVQFPSDQQVLGPLQAQARIEQDDDISAYITLRSREGSQVIRGNMQVLPIADSILYVEPLFLQNPNAEIPELARVAVVMGERTTFDRTLAGALSQLIGVEVPDTIADEETVDPITDPDDAEDAPDPDEPDPDAEAQISEQLLRDALTAFAEADEALRNGDLAGYQAAVARAQQLLEDAAEAQGISVAELFGAAGDDEEELSDAELLEELEEGENGGATEGEDAGTQEP